MQNNSLVRKAARAARSLMGQKQFYRAARLLMYEAMFDVLNDPETNGEKTLQKIVLEHTAKPMVFDIGANVGDWTGMLLDQVKAPIEAHAFEPVPGTFEILRKNLARFANQPFKVELVEAACSDQPGTSKMSISAAGAGTNALNSSGEGVDVVLTTVDAYCASHGISHIDLLKIDAEGYDLLVLRGALHLLGDRQVEVLQFEYNHRWMATRTLLKDAFELLQPLGYDLGKLCGDGIQFYTNWSTAMESYREGNYVACLPVWKTRFHVIPDHWTS